MSIDQLINVLVTVMLIEMMVSLGLGLRITELTRVAKDWSLLVQAGLANYVIVPIATVALLLWFKADPMVAAGFLILAVCPGAPFAPACTRIAKGDVAASVGVMVILASSSAIAAPLLLRLLLPIVSTSESLRIDTAKIVGSLLVVQLLPLTAGVCLGFWRPKLAARLEKPARQISAALSLLTAVVILSAHFSLLANIRLVAYVGMCALLLASWAAGWLLGGSSRGTRKAMMLTTALRNVGVGLVIAAGNFGGTGAVTAVLAYGILEIAGTLLLAAGLARQGSSPDEKTG
jgi:bile acid:Na+ symporter, BASS family